MLIEMFYMCELLKIRRQKKKKKKKNKKKKKKKHKKKKKIFRRRRRNSTKQENKYLSIHNDNYEGEIMLTIIITNVSR